MKPQILTGATLRVVLATFAIAFAATAVPSPGSHAEGRERSRKELDHERARQAVLRGEVLPIARILSIAQRAQKGEVIEVELEAKRGRIYYEVEVLTREGIVRQLLLDARTGAILPERKD